MQLRFTASLWRWQGDAPAAWHFVTLPAEIAGQVKFITGKRKGFGSVRVKARIGASDWNTSLFPDKKTGSFLLPIKADVRQKEGLRDGVKLDVTLVLDA